jgi:hypothetical protein
MTTTKQLAEIAYGYGLDLFTYSPGDGVTRYRFARSGEQTCYFSGNGITVVLGRKEARLWLLGYADALRTQGFAI